jgi:hypothetical protein
MLTLSKALSANQARTYHAREFTSEKQNYWSRDRQGHSEWQGELAGEWGLDGSVADEQFARLSLRRLREVINPYSRRLSTDFAAGMIGTVAG